MKRIVLKYGGLSALLLFATCAINYALSRGELDYGKQEIVGYVSMFLAMIFVYFGMRQYRDKVNSGSMSFPQGITVGMLIALLPSIAFGVFNAIYVKYLDPGFVEKYYNASMQQLADRKLPPEELQKQLNALRGQKEMFGNVFVSSFIMMLTVLIIGVVVSAACALILKRKKNVQVN